MVPLGGRRDVRTSARPVTSAPSFRQPAAQTRVVSRATNGPCSRVTPCRRSVFCTCMTPPQTGQGRAADSTHTRMPPVERTCRCPTACKTATSCLNAASAESETALFFFYQAVAPEDLLDLGAGDGHTPGHEARGDLQGIESHDGAVNDLQEHLDHRRRVEVPILQCGRERASHLDAARDLGGRAYPVVADVQVLSVERLAAEALLGDEIGQRVVDAEPQATVQLPVELAGVGLLDETDDRLLYRPVAREQEPCVLPQAVWVEDWDVP